MEEYEDWEAHCGKKILDLFWRYKCVKPLFVQRDGLPMSAFFMLHKIEVCGKLQKENGGDDGVRISEVSRRTQMSMPAVSQMLNSLEGKGLVARSMTKNDRRAVFVCLTEKGKALLEQNRKEIFSILDEAEHRLGTENLNQLKELSARLFDILLEIEKEKLSDNRG